MSPILVASVIWLHFTTPKGEVVLRKDQITSAFSTVNEKNCRNEKGELICPVEKFICVQNICHSIIWTDPFEKLKEFITKEDTPKVQEPKKIVPKPIAEDPKQ